MADRPPEGAPPLQVQPSSIHGLGVFATRRIPRGTRIVEYVGERLTVDEVDRRYADDGGEPGHTFLFRVSDEIYVDAARAGNEARFINHSCAPNCEAEVDDERVFITALADIEPGVELTYDYALEPEDEPPPSWESVYACRCGAAGCRGTVLAPGSEPRGLV